MCVIAGYLPIELLSFNSLSLNVVLAQNLPSEGKFLLFDHTSSPFNAAMIGRWNKLGAWGNSLRETKKVMSLSPSDCLPPARIVRLRDFATNVVLFLGAHENCFSDGISSGELSGRSVRHGKREESQVIGTFSDLLFEIFNQYHIISISIAEIPEIRKAGFRWGRTSTSQS
jgi:hypothetical protein